MPWFEFPSNPNSNRRYPTASCSQSIEKRYAQLVKDLWDRVRPILKNYISFCWPASKLRHGVAPVFGAPHPWQQTYRSAALALAGSKGSVAPPVARAGAQGRVEVPPVTIGWMFNP